MNSNCSLSCKAGKGGRIGATFWISKFLTRKHPKVNSSHRSHRKNRRAAAAVEFAVVAPLFFLFVFGMIEFGRMVMVQQVLTNASREGARLAVLDGTLTSDVKNTVVGYLNDASIPAAVTDVVVTPDPLGGAAFGDPVTVEISIRFDQVSWLPTPMYISGDKLLSATTVMRRESVQ